MPQAVLPAPVRPATQSQRVFSLTAEPAPPYLARTNPPAGHRAAAHNPAARKDVYADPSWLRTDLRRARTHADHVSPLHAPLALRHAAPGGQAGDRARRQGARIYRRLWQPLRLDSRAGRQG